MAKILNRDEEIDKLEYNLSLLKHVKEKFPNYQLKIDNDKYLFVDKSVNKLFNTFKILDNGSEIRLQVYYATNFKYNDKEYIIKIGCIPKSCALLSVSGAIYYHKPIFKSINKDLQLELTKACNFKTLEIMKKYHYAKIDTKSFPEKLKKLLVFS